MNVVNPYGIQIYGYICVSCWRVWVCANMKRFFSLNVTMTVTWKRRMDTLALWLYVRNICNFVIEFNDFYFIIMNSNNIWNILLLSFILIEIFISLFAPTTNLSINEKYWRNSYGTYLTIADNLCGRNKTDRIKFDLYHLNF